MRAAYQEEAKSRLGVRGSFGQALASVAETVLPESAGSH